MYYTEARNKKKVKQRKQEARNIIIKFNYNE